MHAVEKDGVPRGAIPVVLMRNLAVRNNYTTIIYVKGGKLEGSEISEESSQKEVESAQAVEKDGVERGAIPVVLMCNWAVGSTSTTIIYVQSGKLEGSEITKKRCQKEVESVQAVKKDGVPRGAFPVVLMGTLAVGNTYPIIMNVQGGKLEGSERKSGNKVLKNK